ncbi:MAG: hypothetical protein U9N41_06970 [Euryarchaeota archaeon]|nr:hypothetical protein [Euryarchaeota archaeon]
MVDMRYLRYYAPDYDQNEHGRILQLLEEIKRKHGIEYEEIPVEERDWYNRKPVMTERAVYENYLKPQTRVIKSNDPDAETVAKKFKSRSGNIFVAGTIAAIEDEKVLWGTPFKQSEFLEGVLEKGWGLINKFQSGKEVKDIHSELFKRLKENNLPQPEIRDKVWLREIVVGFRKAGIRKEDVNREYDEDIAKKFDEELKIAYKKMCELNLIDDIWYKKTLQRDLSSKYGFGSPLFVMFVDFLVLSEGSNWVIEGKEKLNYEAIGQVLVYKDLLKEDYLELGEIKKGIACFEGDERLEPTCKKLGIEVFVL